jgi:ubiquinone/menaquinone biosynthesis C-methylase UbiE
VCSEFEIGGEACLDIACGDGELSNNFLSNNYSKVDAVDISRELIKNAKSKKNKNCSFNIDDIDNFIRKKVNEGKKYDSVYLLAILEHIQWPSIFISEVNKLVKKGGYMVVEVPNVAWLPHRISLLCGKFPITAPTIGVIPGVFDEHIRFFTIETLDLIMKNLGLRKVKTDCSGKFRYIKRIYLRLLSPDIVAIYKK